MGNRASTDFSGGAGRHHRKFRNYLLDKKLQLRYVAVVTLLSAALASTLGYLVWRQETRASNYIKETLASKELANYPDELKRDIVDQLSRDDRSLVGEMVAYGCGLALVLSLYLVVMTHKVAGPLHKVSVYFDRMRDGRLGKVTPLRRGDELRGFYDRFKESHDAVRDRLRAESEALGRFIEACGKVAVPESGRLGHRLDEARSFKKQRDEALA